MFFCRFVVRVFATFCIVLFAPAFCFAQVGLWDAGLDCPGGSIGFKLNVESSGKDDWKAWLINGSEKIEIPKAELNLDGTLTLDMEHYDSRLVLKVENAGDANEQLSGTWKKRRGTNKWVEMEFSAVPASRVDSTQSKLNAKFDGRWQVNFSSSDEPAVGVFESDRAGRLRGTFLTTTGDYRYLAGNEDDKSMQLSCFDGAHAFLFKATLKDDGSLTGDFWSSTTWHEKWTATRDEDAELPDDFELTKATSPNINTLAFPNLDGKETRLDNDQFAAPVRIVHVFGSWCPNCHDAGTYLATLKQTYGKKISVVGVAFELTGDFERDAEQVRKYLKRHKLDHPVLIGGKSSKAEASKVMTIIDKVRSYPTTIFANSGGKIVAVHQGFVGPATGDAYLKLKTKFTSVIDGILEAAK